jgi:RimJ/RimL family protein N-acetyltransferase
VEAEDFVRGSVLRRVKYTLAFRDEQDALIAVSAFDERQIRVPVIDPVAHQGWHLQVVAIALPYQRLGISQMVFEETFAAMREIDESRIHVTANVHNEHRSSIKACAHVGLEYWIPKNEHFTILIGEVPEG